MFPHRITLIEHHCSSPSAVHLHVSSAIRRTRLVPICQRAAVRLIVSCTHSTHQLTTDYASLLAERGPERSRGPLPGSCASSVCIPLTAAIYIYIYYVLCLTLFVLFYKRYCVYSRVSSFLTLFKQKLRALYSSGNKRSM